MLHAHRPEMAELELAGIEQGGTGCGIQHKEVATYVLPT